MTRWSRFFFSKRCDFISRTFMSIYKDIKERLLSFFCIFFFTIHLLITWVISLRGKIDRGIQVVGNELCFSKSGILVWLSETNLYHHNVYQQLFLLFEIFNMKQRKVSVSKWKILKMEGRDENWKDRNEKGRMKKKKKR